MDTEEKDKRKRKNNRIIGLHRDSNTYLLNMFVGFCFFPINMHWFFDL